MKTIKSEVENKSGFTLLEMVMAVGLFSVLIIVAVGITIGITNAQIKIQNIQTTFDNARFNLELITKELRTGSAFTGSSSCGTAGSRIEFINSHDKRRLYMLDTETKILKRLKKDNDMPFTLDECSSGGDLSSEDVNVERFAINLSGQNLPPIQDGQPMVTISMKISSKNPSIIAQTSMEFQTTVIQRLRE